MVTSAQQDSKSNNASLDALSAQVEKAWMRVEEDTPRTRKTQGPKKCKCSDPAKLDAVVAAVERRPPVSTFAELVQKYVREKCGGRAAVAYRAAGVSRQVYSALISNRERLVAKRTAVAFAFAFKLGANEASALVKSAGVSLTPAIKEDAVFLACFRQGVWSLFDVNYVLEKCGCRPLPVNR